MTIPLLFIIWWPARRKFKEARKAGSVESDDALAARVGYEPFRWKWTIPMIGIVIIAVEVIATAPPVLAQPPRFVAALIDDRLSPAPERMISLISPIRRCNAIVSFSLAALIFHECNMLRKGLCLLGILAGIGIIIWGSM